MWLWVVYPYAFVKVNIKPNITTAPEQGFSLLITRNLQIMSAPNKNQWSHSLNYKGIKKKLPPNQHPHKITKKKKNTPHQKKKKKKNMQPTNQRKKQTTPHTTKNKMKQW